MPELWRLPRLGRKFLLPLLLAFASPAFQAQAQSRQPEPADRLLREMIQANHKLRYDGVFLYRRDDLISPVRVIHHQPGEQKIVSLNGLVRGHLPDRAGASGASARSEDRSYLLKNPNMQPDRLAPLPRLSIRQVQQYYDLQVTGEGRVVGRPVWILEARPLDDMRYGRRFHIDRATCLLLQSEVKEANGRIIEQITFVSLRLLEPETTEDDAASSRGWEEEAPVAGEEGQPGWSFSPAARGFALADGGLQPLRIAGAPVNQVVLSDGLASVSVFIEVRPGEALHIPEGSTNLSGLNAHTVYKDGYQVTAIGAVPLRTVRLIADSARPASGP